MQANSKVFITGLSALSAIGETIEENWDAIIGGKSGIETISSYELSSWQAKLGGEIKSFNYSKILPDRKLLKLVSKHDVYGINAAIQAVSHSELLNYRASLENQDAFNEATAIVVGSPGNKYYQQYDFLPLLAKTKDSMQAFAEGLFSEVHPTWLLKILPNNVLAYTAITYGFKGSNHNITNHAVGGAQALIEAYHLIRSGQAERAVVVAYDCAIEPQALYYYEKLGLISAKELRPFDKEHDGTILAEGAAAIVLESEASVASRSARCYGELIGGFSTTESQGLFSIEEDGESLSSLLKTTLDFYDLKPEDLGMIVAHGNGSKLSDNSEARALRACLNGSQVPVTAFKWATGHTICSSGLLDCVFTTYALSNKLVPGIANLQEPAPECADLNLSTGHRFLKDKDYALVINRGFASMNASIVIKNCD